MLTVEIDGNDGTGKTYLINRLHTHILNEFNNLYWVHKNIEFKDRGILSEVTLSDEWNKENPNIASIYRLATNYTLYILVDDIPEKCQERILARGDSIDEEYHTLNDLIKYRERFNRIRDIFFTDIIYVKKNGEDFTDDDIHTLSLIIIDKLHSVYKKHIEQLENYLNIWQK